MVLIGMVSERMVLPTGSYTAPWAGIAALSVLLSSDIIIALIVTIAAVALMLLSGTADWLSSIDILMTIVIVAWLIGWRLPDSQVVTHQQLIFIGVTAGLLQFLFLEVGMTVMGWIFDQQWATALAFGRLGFSTSILTALLYAVLTPLLSWVSRWVCCRWLKFTK